MIQKGFEDEIRRPLKNEKGFGNKRPVICYPQK
jgi:hypothetical protein